MTERFINCPVCRNHGIAPYRLIQAAWKSKFEKNPETLVYATGSAPRFCKRHQGELMPFLAWGPK